MVISGFSTRTWASLAPRPYTGHLDHGRSKAGFETVAPISWNADACATLRRNRPDWRVIEGEKRDAIFGQYGPVDLVAGGPPCQPCVL